MTKDELRAVEAERRKYLRDRGRCICCNKQDAYTLNGRLRCFECTQINNANAKAYRDRNRAKISERSAARKQYREANRLCLRCGKPLNSCLPYKTCDACRAKDTMQQRARKEKRIGSPYGIRDLRAEFGECIQCGEQVKPGLNSKGNSFKLCERCMRICGVFGYNSR